MDPNEISSCPPAAHWGFGSLNPTSGLGTAESPVDHWLDQGLDPIAIQVTAEHRGLARLHEAWPHFKINLELGRDPHLDFKQILVKYPKTTLDSYMWKAWNLGP